MLGCYSVVAMIPQVVARVLLDVCCDNLRGCFGIPGGCVIIQCGSYGLAMWLQCNTEQLVGCTWTESMEPQMVSSIFICHRCVSG